MWNYYIRLAWISIKKTPVLSALMILAIATGIAASLTTITLYSVIASNPMAHKNDTLFAVQLDSWDPEETFWAANGVPLMLTFRDAKALYQADVAEETLIMFRAGLTVRDINGQQLPKVEGARMTTNSFFSLFDVPFVYGSSWDESADQNGAKHVVIAESLNHAIFNGENSVGKNLLLEGESYTVTGVVADSWSLTPSVYDLNINAFKQPETIYIPFLNIERQSFPSWGDSNGWKYEQTSSYQESLMTEQVWVQAWVSLLDARQYQDYEQFLRNYINEQKQLGRFQRPLKFHLNTPEQWLAINAVVSQDNRILVGLSLAFLLVCLVNAVVLLLAKFLRKAPEAGLRRALGASRQAIFIQHLTEAVVIGSAGAAFGLALSWLGLLGIRVLYADYQQLAVMSLTTLFGALLLAIVSSLLSGILPAWQIARAQPARYLKSQ
ncbi:MAG TPA: ABC transporter permease [Cellvibrionaceae bacterium]